MNQKENGELQSIAKHVTVLNKEVGLLQKDVNNLKTNMGVMKTDVRWIKKLLFGIAGMIFIGVGKVLFFG